ncbi:hypothetical protein E3N88_45826 [Mikania micrantha]|uniref:Uncharacterized protein n=1 Tax=Mikania micrantha TaxID=192012 RepID=A0A5N6LAD9_9ASTR|nr:hypothetical protein E3N88_45826 [Mikania micrantha]
MSGQVDARLATIRETAAGSKKVLEHHVSSFDWITLNAKGKWQDFSMQLENDAKENADFAAAKHCRSKSVLQKCINVTESALNRSKTTCETVIEMGKQHVTAVDAFVRNAIDDNDHHYCEINSFRQIAEDDVLKTGEDLSKHTDQNVVNFMAHIKVNWQSFILSQHSSCMDLLRGFSSSYAGGVDNTTALQEYNTEVGVALLDQQVNEHYESDGFEHSEGHMTNESEESEFPPSNDDSEGEDQIPFSSEQYNSGVYQGFSQSFDLNEPIEESDDYVLPDFDDEDHMDVWNEDSNEIRLGMYFKSNAGSGDIPLNPCA